MSRFLLLNFEDFGLGQDITQTIQSQTLVCICCLDSNVPLINLVRCKHEYYLQSFYKSVLEPSKKVVCFQCHKMLKNIENFRQQVLTSFKNLEAEATAKIHGTNRHNLSLNNAVNIYLPPAKYVPSASPYNPVKPLSNKVGVVKKEMECIEPALPVVNIKAEPEENAEEQLQTVIDAVSKGEEVPDPQSPAPAAVRTVTLTRQQLEGERLRRAQSPGYLRHPHRCASCLMGFHYEENIRDHNERKHGPKVGSVTCEICLAVLYPPGSLNAHMFRHLTRYECVICNQRYTTYDDALSHNRKEHSEKMVYRCQDCLFSTDSPQKLRKHKRMHQKRFTCKDCGVVLATRPSLKRHLAALHNKRLYACAHCGSSHTGGAAFAAHMRRHGAAAARAACAPCGVQFKAWHAYNAHVLLSAAHAEQRDKIACNYCGMKFATPTHLRMHVKFSNHPKQTFYCPECPKEFSVEIEMKQHRRVHKKQRLKSTDRICDYCGRVYTSREHLIRHIETHMQKLRRAK